MNVEKIALKFLGNRKLETVSKYRLGSSSFKKSLDYDELGELELEAITAEEIGDIHSAKNKAKEALKYVIGDVDILQKLISKASGNFPPGIDENKIVLFYNLLKKILLKDEKKYVTPYSFDDISKISQIFMIEPARVSHVANSVLIYYERKFFDENGTFFNGQRYQMKDKRRDKKTGEMKVRKQNRMAIAKGNLQHLINKIIYEGVPESNIGEYKNVRKIYVPHADYVAKLLFKNNPSFKEFMMHKFEKDKDGKYKSLHDSDRQFFMSQYAEAFIMPVVFDYFHIKNNIRKIYEPLWKKGISEDELNEIEKEIQALIKEKKSGSLSNYIKNRFYGLHECLTGDKGQTATKIRNFKKEKSIASYSKLLEIIYAYRKNFKKINSDIKFEKYRFDAVHGFSYENFEDTLIGKIKDAKEKIYEQNATVIHSPFNHSRFFYVSGLKNPLNAKLISLQEGMVEITDEKFSFIVK